MKGRDIIKAVMREHLVSPEEFFGNNRLPRFVAARREAAKRMAAAGIRVPVIARLMKRHPRTVAYHVNDSKRLHDLARAARYYAARRNEARPYWSNSRRHQTTGATA